MSLSPKRTSLERNLQIRRDNQILVSKIMQIKSSKLPKRSNHSQNSLKTFSNTFSKTENAFPLTNVKSSINIIQLENEFKTHLKYRKIRSNFKKN